eukprot:2092273-Pleurochrysis_carterae.AAC.6
MTWSNRQDAAQGEDVLRQGDVRLNTLRTRRFDGLLHRDDFEKHSVNSLAEDQNGACLTTAHACLQTIARSLAFTYSRPAAVHA